MLYEVITEFLGTVVMVLVVWFGASLITSDGSGLTGATFLAFIGMFYQIINPAKAFSSAFFSIQKGLARITSYNVCYTKLLRFGEESR